MIFVGWSCFLLIVEEENPAKADAQAALQADIF